jgi:YHS domain-containing protein
MYTRFMFARVVCALTLALTCIDARPVSAQSPSPAGQASPDVPTPREGSGTSWLPDATPMYAIHDEIGAWQLMLHENAFLQSLREASERVGGQFGSINWIMGMARRDVGRGRLMFRAMFSAEPWTIGGCGYPDLLASGEQCNGGKIHDLQHPHDLFMELAAQYDRPLNGQVSWQVYGGPVGDPALGPVAYPHRLSSMPNPLAPIAHHWLDSTHVSFGVVTAGLYGHMWKAETSVFNGREPDEERTDFDFGRLDSISGRFWFLPNAKIALQVSAGRVKQAEAAEGPGPRLDVNKITASATYHRIRDHTVWASTIGWGRNSELNRGTNALLAETSFILEDRDAWFARFELAGKTPNDLAVAGLSDIEALTKVQGGYTRYLPSLRGFRAGLGAEVSVGFVPNELRATYGSRANVGGGIFLTLRPAMMIAGASGGMVMVQTSLDPAKLSCAPPFSPSAAPTATYEGKTYFFCSAKDRDEFLKDPKMSLSMMPPKQ